MDTTPTLVYHITPLWAARYKILIPKYVSVMYVCMYVCICVSYARPNHFNCPIEIGSAPRMVRQAH